MGWPRDTTSFPEPTWWNGDPPPDEDDREWCEHCHNTGSLDCYCGGDLCICENNGEYPCPYCREGD